MSQPDLDNLVRIGQLKAEPRNAPEVTRMLAMAQTRLSDAKLSNVSHSGALPVRAKSSRASPYITGFEWQRSQSIIGKATLPWQAPQYLPSKFSFIE